VGCAAAADLARPLDHPCLLGIANLASMYLGLLPVLKLGLFPWMLGLPVAASAATRPRS
jgi:hypothetical protein